MIFQFFLILPLVFASPDMLVDWEGSSNEAVNVSVRPGGEVLETCLQAGMEVRFNFEAQICRRRSMWLPDCGERLQMIHAIQYDPISETYQVSSDRIGDRRPEQTVTLESREESFALASRLQHLSLKELGLGSQFAVSERAFLSLKATGDCRGEYSEILSRIGYYLSLGLVRINAFNSGWVAYELKSTGASSLTAGKTK